MSRESASVGGAGRINAQIKPTPPHCMWGVANRNASTFVNRGWPINPFAKCPKPSAVVFVVADVVEDRQLVPAAGDGNDVAQPLPESALVPLVAEREMGVTFGVSDGGEHQRIGEASQEVKVDGIE